MASKRWVTICLKDSVLHVSEHDLRSELARWTPSKVYLPGMERGKPSASHPYALFAFVPDDYSAEAWAARRSRYVEHVLLDTISDKDLQKSLAKVSTFKFGDSVCVHGGPLTGVEGTVVRCRKQSVQIRISLRSGDRSVWVRCWEVALR